MDDYDLYAEIWDEAAKYELEFQKELARIRDRVFKHLTRSKGKNFVKHLKIAMKEWECSGQVETTKRLQGGSWQKENFGPIKKVYIQQYSSGDSGDSFYGWCYVEIRKASLIKPALYLKCHFAC